MIVAKLIDERVGYDCTFELDEFNKPRLCSETETVKNTVLFILFSRPGQYPSLPNIGMDIRNMLYTYYDEIDERILEDKLIEQCAALGQYFDNGNIVIRKMIYRKMPSLLIHIKTDGGDTIVTKKVAANKLDRSLEFYIGLSVNEINELLYNINQRYVDSY